MYSRRTITRRGNEIENSMGKVKYFSYLISGLSFLAIISTIIIQFFVYYSKSTPTIFIKNNPLLILISLIIFIIAQFGLYKLFNHLSISTKVLKKSLLIYSLVLGLSISFMFFTAPFADVRSVVNGLMAGTSDAITYAEYYPNNVGIVLLYRLIFNVFGRQAWPVMYILNILSVIGINAILPNVTKIISNSEKAERLTTQLLFFSFPFLFTIPYLYNDLIGIFFTLLSLNFLLNYTAEKNSKLSNLVWCGISLSIALIIRTNTIIFIIGYVIYLILRVIRDRKFTYNHQISFLPIVILLVVQVAFQFSLPKIIPNYSTEYAQPSTGWIAMAMADQESIKGYNFKKPGMFNSFEDWAYSKYKSENPQKNSKDYIKDVNKRKIIYSDFIKQRLKYFASHPVSAATFYTKKEVTLLGDPSFGGDNILFESFKNQEKVNSIVPYESLSALNTIDKNNSMFYEKNKDKMQSSLAKSVTKSNFILNTMERPLLLLSLIGTALLIVKKRFKMNLEVILLLTIFIGGFVFHLFIWETQPRYFLPYFALLIPLSTIGIINFLSSKETS